MAAHRHWAISMLARPGSGNGVSLAEVEWRATPGGADLCSGGTASGTSSFGQVAANAFDNDNATQWFSSTGGSFARLAYDFGAAVTPVELWIKLPGPGTYAGTTYGPAFTRVEWSDDGTTWYVGAQAFDANPLVNSEEMTVSDISDAAPGAVLLDLGFQETFPQNTTTPLIEVGVNVLNYGDYGGLGRIAGDVKIKGLPDAPVARLVRLHRELDGVAVSQLTSDGVTGAYEFLGVNPVYKYTVIAYDLPGGFRAAIASGVVPEPLIV